MAMKFYKRGPYHATTEDGAYVIFRANNVAGGVYTAVRNAGDKRLAVERFADEGERWGAFQRCVAACEADARE